MRIMVVAELMCQLYKGHVYVLNKTKLLHITTVVYLSPSYFIHKTSVHFQVYGYWSHQKAIASVCLPEQNSHEPQRKKKSPIMSR